MYVVLLLELSRAGLEGLVPGVLTLQNMFAGFLKSLEQGLSRPPLIFLSIYVELSLLTPVSGDMWRSAI